MALLQVSIKEMRKENICKKKMFFFPNWGIWNLVPKSKTVLKKKERKDADMS